MMHELNKRDLGPCMDCACFNTRKAARVVTQVFDEIMQPSGVRATQFPILVMIARRGAATMTELAESLVMDRTTLTRNLKPLEDQGLIKGVPGTDRRTRSISLTAKGQRILSEALPLWKKAQARVVRHLGGSTFNRVLGDLRLMTQVESSA